VTQRVAHRLRSLLLFCLSKKRGSVGGKDARPEVTAQLAPCLNLVAAQRPRRAWACVDVAIELAGRLVFTPLLSARFQRCPLLK
jgi:hypothetical protein